MSTSFQLSLEAIAFQLNSKLKDFIGEQFEAIIKSNGDLQVLDVSLQAINDATRTSTGVWMEPTIVKDTWFESPYRIEAEPVNFNALNPLNMKAVKRLESYDLDNLDIYDVINGAVDLKNARVTGFFTELKNRFLISLSTFNGTFTGAELAALYLHEVGHAFELYFFMCETLITNTILAEVIGRIDSEEVYEKKIYLGIAALKLSKVNTVLDTLKLKSADITALVMEGQVLRMQQRTGSRWYDHRLSEAVADQFAARWMAASALVSALGKLERSKRVFLSTTGFDPIWVGIASNVFSIVSLPFNLVPKGTTVAVSRSLLLLKKVAKNFSFSLILNGVAFVAGNSKRYDPLPVRFQAIRRELVSLLKNQDLDATIRKQALTDIQLIDDELSKIHNYGDVMGKIASYTLGLLTQRNIELNRNNTLEELANNRFYELSALFKG